MTTAEIEVTEQLTWAERDPGVNEDIHLSRWVEASTHVGGDKVQAEILEYEPQSPAHEPGRVFIGLSAELGGEYGRAEICDAYPPEHIDAMIEVLTTVRDRARAAGILPK